MCVKNKCECEHGSVDYITLFGAEGPCYVAWTL